MTNQLRHWGYNRKLSVLCGIVFAMLGVALAVSFLKDNETPVLRMSVGPEMTRRHAVAACLAEEAGRNDLSIKLIPSAGSEECLELLKSGQLDAAIVSGGIVVPDGNDIMVVGALQLEAVHVLIRKDMTQADSLSETIRGKRVNLGEKGSVEWMLARDFLNFARLKLPSGTQPGDIVPSELGKSELMDKCKAILRANGAEKDKLIAELPDCLLVLGFMPSQVVQHIIGAADYRIVSIPAARAYLSDNLQDGHAGTIILQREYLERTVIPMNSYFTTRGYPVEDCETVGSRLLIVAHKQADARAVQRLMKTLFESQLTHRLQPKSPREVATPYAIHAGALAYLDRDKPLLVINKAMEWFSKGLSIFGAFSAGALSLYSLLRRKKTRTPAQYFAAIRKLELAGLYENVDSGTAAHSNELARDLDCRLLKLRQDLIEDICEGRIKGDQVIANILTLLRDARRNLPKLEAVTVGVDDRLLGNYRSSQKAA